MSWIKEQFKSVLTKLLASAGNAKPKAVGAEGYLDVTAAFVGNLDGMSIGRRVRIERFATLECHSSESTLSIGDGTIVKSFAILSTQPGGSIRVGAHCSINPYCVLYGHGGLTIGDNVRIATHTVIVPANHVYDRRDIPIREQGLTKRGVTVGDDVWIGAGVTILDGCSIGTGAVIAAGAVVTGDIPEYTIAGGIPARVIKHRP